VTIHGEGMGIFWNHTLYKQEYFCTNNSVKAGNDVIDILASEDVESTPLKSQIQFCMNLTSSLFSTIKNTLVYIINN